MTAASPPSNGQTPESTKDEGLLSKGPLDDEIPRRENRVSNADKEIGLTAGFVALFLFIHVLAVSGWNWNTAADIADSFNFEDSISIVFGTLFELPVLTGAFAAIILPIALFRLYWTRKTATVSSSMKNLFIVAAIGATEYVLIRSFGMWWPAITTAVIFTLLVIVSLVWVHGKAHRFIANLGKHTGILLLIGLGTLGLLVDTPWMPREHIETQDGLIQGHVLEATPGFLKVLTDDREVLIMLDSEIVSRKPADD